MTIWWRYAHDCVMAGWGGGVVGSVAGKSRLTHNDSLAPPAPWRGFLCRRARHGGRIMRSKNAFTRASASGSSGFAYELLLTSAALGLDDSRFRGWRSRLGRAVVVGRGWRRLRLVSDRRRVCRCPAGCLSDDRRDGRRRLALPRRTFWSMDVVDDARWHGGVRGSSGLCRRLRLKRRRRHQYHLRRRLLCGINRISERACQRKQIAVDFLR
jgi:hypothetical protein